MGAGSGTDAMSMRVGEMSVGDGGRAISGAQYPSADPLRPLHPLPSALMCNRVWRARCPIATHHILQSPEHLVEEVLHAHRPMTKRQKEREKASTTHT